jgi:starch-binding outer membrane protein, SusD/RagB family
LAFKSVHNISLRATARLLVCSMLVCCSRLTDVNAPDLVTPDKLANAAGAEALRIGAINGFALMFAGDENGQITTSGAIADEFFNSSSAVIALAYADIRQLPEPSTSYPYRNLQRARLDIERAIVAKEEFAANPPSEIAELFSLSAYTRDFLGENMCSGIPLGHIVEGDLVFGEPLSTQELFEDAVANFDSSIAYGRDSARLLNLARVGKGRALLNLGRFAEAAAAVAAVPTSYTYQTFHAPIVQPNGVFAIMNNAKWLTVADREGINGLDFRSASDPRVPTAFVGKGPDQSTDVYTFTRYGSLSAPIVLASGIEARLIEAEALLKSGDANGALSILNALRATTPGLAPLTQPSTLDQQIDQLFRERAFWMFATGHRHGDLRRLVREYSRPPESVFPTGPYKNGLTYGTDVTFPPDNTQLGNPNYKGCLSRDA